MAKTNQIQQISTFLSAYPRDVVELGIETWRTGEMPVAENQIKERKRRMEKGTKGNE